MLKTGDTIPKFNLKDQRGNVVSSEDIKGSWYVMYFYPKDDTPGCTQESCEFRDNLDDFKNLNVKVFGISRDSVKSHEKFANKFDLNFSILSDENSELCNAFGVIVEKNMYGKITQGIQRSTFIINPDGKITYIWEKVKVNGHVEEVKQKLAELV